MDFFTDGLRRGAQLLVSGDAEVFGITLLSLRVALVATFFSCAFGIPLGFAVGTTRFWAKRGVITALNTMLAFPTVVVGLIIWGLLARGGPLGEAHLLYTWWAIVIAEIILATPIAAALTAAAVQGIDPRVRRTAMTLGASPWRVHWTVAREARYALSAAKYLVNEGMKMDLEPALKLEHRIIARMASAKERQEAVQKAMETQATYKNIFGKRDED